MGEKKSAKQHREKYFKRENNKKEQMIVCIKRRNFQLDENRVCEKIFKRNQPLNTRTCVRSVRQKAYDSLTDWKWWRRTQTRRCRPRRRRSRRSTSRFSSTTKFTTTKVACKSIWFVVVTTTTTCELPIHCYVKVGGEAPEPSCFFEARFKRLWTRKTDFCSETLSENLVLTSAKRFQNIPIVLKECLWPRN